MKQAVTSVLIGLLLFNSAGCATMRTQPVDRSESHASKEDTRPESVRKRESARRSLWFSVGCTLASGVLWAVVAEDSDGRFGARSPFPFIAVGAGVLGYGALIHSIHETQAADAAADRELERAIRELRQRSDGELEEPLSQERGERRLGAQTHDGIRWREPRGRAFAAHIGPKSDVSLY